MSNGTRRSRMMKKTGVKKSRWTVPLSWEIGDSFLFPLGTAPVKEIKLGLLLDNVFLLTYLTNHTQ